MAYPYRIAKNEITTGQWLEFVNTFGTRADSPPFFGQPNWWGAGLDGTYHGPGYRWVLNTSFPHAADLPVIGISWRAAAEYCNWVCNDKRTDWAAIQTGAYDVSTFTNNPDGTVNDQAAHLPGARFWIPTLDEWPKAVHYDPNHYGPGVGGWWGAPNATDEPMISGPPGQGQTGAGLPAPGPQYPESAYYFPLGSYPNERSPWGLLDTSGGASEWLEDFADPLRPRARLVDGTWQGCSSDWLDLDRPNSVTAFEPYFATYGGLRIASSVPAPSAWFALALAALGLSRRRSS